MAFKLVQQKVGVGSTANGSLTFDATPGEGNMLFAIAFVAVAAGALGGPAGFNGDGGSFVRPVPTNVMVGKGVRRTAGAAESPIVTWGHAAATWEMLILEFSGGEDSADIYDTASAMATGSSVHTLQPGSATPAREGSLCIAWCTVKAANGGTETVGSGFTLIGDATFAISLAAYKIKADNDKAAENPAFGWTTNQDCGATMLIYKSAEPATKRSLYVPSSVGRQSYSGGF